jgi:FkbM family methyltransferase
MKIYEKFSLFLNELKWFFNKGLLLFLSIEIIRVVLLLFGYKFRNKILKILKLEEINGIINLGSIKIILRFKDVGIFREIFEWNIYRVPSKKRKLILDVGANVGFFSLRYSNKTEKIIAIEPHPRNFEILNKNIKINGIRNIEALNLAINDKVGNSILYGSGGSASIINNSSDEKYVVKTTTLDEICKNIEKIDLLKIDVEGAEELVLKGGNTTLNKVHTLVVEVHHDWVKEESIIKVLSNVGFKIKKLPSYVERTSILFCENKHKI